MTRSAPYPGRIKGDFASLKRAGIPGAGDYHGPGSTLVVDGLRDDGPVAPVKIPRVRWKCSGCRKTNLGEDVRGRFPGGTLSTHRWCPRCEARTLQQRVRKT